MVPALTRPAAAVVGNGCRVDAIAVAGCKAGSMFGSATVELEA
jgi:hypothetical protein